VRKLNQSYLNKGGMEVTKEEKEKGEREKQQAKKSDSSLLDIIVRFCRNRNA
jgi:hypothetical protein